MISQTVFSIFPCSPLPSGTCQTPGFIWSVVAAGTRTILNCLLLILFYCVLETQFTLYHHRHHHHRHHHQSLNREGRWGTKDDFATRFLHFPLLSTAIWDLANSRPVCSLMLSSHLFLCLPCLPPPFAVPCKMVLARPGERETCCLLYTSPSPRDVPRSRMPSSA